MKILCVLYDNPKKGMPKKYPLNKLPVIKKYPNGQTLPTPKGRDFKPGTLLGCVTPNKIIKKIPNPTAIVICKKSSKGKNCSTKIATKDVIKWPKKTFFG